MLIRAIAPNWALEENTSLQRVVEGEFDENEIIRLNELYYNIYYLPNHPSIYHPDTIVSGFDIDTFSYVFVDMDMKEGKYASKEAFLEKLLTFPLLPTKIVDSGNGIHAYWKVSDLDGKTYLKLQRRLIRQFNTDEAVGQIFQLMRVPNTVNTKKKEDLKICEELFVGELGAEYTAEMLDKHLSRLSPEDAAYCEHHFDKTYRLNQTEIKVDDKIPLKFSHLIKDNEEVREIWSGNVDDRSKGDYRIGHIMFAHAFTRDEAMSVLVNSAKALQRAPTHRISYATNIVDKIWTYELAEDKSTLTLSSTVKDILTRSNDVLKGTRLPTWSYLDDTVHGFRLGQVIGLVAGSGVGKTSMALNMFQGFVKNNPDYHHFFIPLEQPTHEIAERWKTICGDETELHDKVHLISNYADDGSFRHLSFAEIKDYILKFQDVTGHKIGAVVIDHIGALKKKGKEGENQDLMTICHEMKAFAVQTNTMLIMQSQAPREKTGIGDLELNKDAAYGTVYFESYCDYLITLWQPLKRSYSEEGCPTIMAFKFCKIRHKKQGHDEIKEDVPYKMLFDPLTERLRSLTQDEEKGFRFWLTQSTNKRKADRKTDLVEYQSVKWA